MDDSEPIAIGRFALRTPSGPIRIEARTAPGIGTVWLARIDPGPPQLLGYVLAAHAPGAYFQSYTNDLPETAADELRDAAVGLWTEAAGRGRVRLRHAVGPVRLGLEVFEGLRVDFTWTRLGVVSLDFRDLEPERLGTVTDLDGTEPCLRPASPHTAWAEEPGRAERLIAAAAGAYRRRPDTPFPLEPGRARAAIHRAERANRR